MGASLGGSTSPLSSECVMISPHVVGGADCCARDGVLEGGTKLVRRGSDEPERAVPRMRALHRRFRCSAWHRYQQSGNGCDQKPETQHLHGYSPPLLARTTLGSLRPAHLNVTRQLSGTCGSDSARSRRFRS